MDMQCDEGRPVCNRCKKANLVCRGTEEERSKFLFLNENEYAVGRRKRPRGPNIKTTSTAGDSLQTTASSHNTSTAGSLNEALVVQKEQVEPLGYALGPALNIPLDDQALVYYSRYYVESTDILPEIADGHLKYASIDRCYSQPQSILSLAIAAVAHATFGRAQKSHAALTLGGANYSKALVKANSSLKDANEVTQDEFLLAAMLLSFYENSVMNRMSAVSGRGIRNLASKSFAHHDGAMAILKLRQQLDQRTDWSLQLDKLVRRQLIRSLLLRSMPIPVWLQNGSQYGEDGYALGLDQCMVEAAELRHQASTLALETVALWPANNLATVNRLLAEAKVLDEALAAWADDLPLDNWYNTCMVEYSGRAECDNMVFDKTVHNYPTVGHAGMWSRYRALRLTVNDIIFKALFVLATTSDYDVKSQGEAAKVRVRHLADDLCASVPYMLGLIEIRNVDGHEVAVVIKTPPSLKLAVKATTASYLAWPLSMSTMVYAIPEPHQIYLRKRLLDVSELVDDGVLERLATGFTPMSPCSANVLQTNV